MNKKTVDPKTKGEVGITGQGESNVYGNIPFTAENTES